MEEVRHVMAGGIMAETIQRLYPQVRTRYEPRIVAVQTFPEAYVLAGVSLRLYRLLLAVKAVSAAGLDDETRALVRSAVESFVSFAYILDVGEAHPEEPLSSRELAERFQGYGDVAYATLIKQIPPARYRNALKRRKGLSDAQVDAHAVECERKSQDALSNGSDKTKWHKQLSLGRMAERVLKHLPAYAEREIAELMFSSFQLGNSATHGDALFLRTHYSEFRNGPLTVTTKEDVTNVDLVARLVGWAWVRVAIYFGDEDWMNERLKEISNEVWQERQSAATSMIATL